MGSNHENMTLKEYVICRSIEELKEEWKQLDCCIENVGCFSTRDLALREVIEEELFERGVRVDEFLQG